MFRETFAAKLKNSDMQVAITGGGSWLGAASLLVLEHAFGDELASRVSVFGSSARLLHLPSGRTIESRPLAEIARLKDAPHLFLHYAFITKSHVGEHALADYVRLNDEIATTVEAAAKRVRLRGFFLPSSGAVYRKDRSLHTVLEDNPYGVTKLRDEARFRSLSEKMDSALMTIRVFNVAGPGVNNIPAFALSSIIAEVLRGQPVRLKAAHPVRRSYVHIVDLIELVLEGLLDSAPNRDAPFDTAGERAIEIGELAQMIVEIMGLPEHPILRPTGQTEPVDNYVGDGAEWRRKTAALGIDRKLLPTQIADTIADLKRRI